jgi:hypothetical protein
MRLGPAFALSLLLAACGSARETPPDPATTSAGYTYNPAESWMLDHMTWVPSFMKPAHRGAE